MLTVVPRAAGATEPGRDGGSSLIDELVREGARRMLAEALQAEVDAYLARFVAERDEHGRRLVVRNGTHRPREVLTSAGAVEVIAPRVNDRRTDPDTGERRRFCSAILPPWCRKTPKITEVLPLLYLHGLSSGDFVPALGQFLGSSAGLSGPVTTKLTETWKAEQRTFAARDLSGADYVYLWADGIHVNIRLDEHKLCLLVLIGVRADGRKELVALTTGTASRPSPGRTCCATARGAGCVPRCSRSGTARSGSGARYARCSPRCGNSAAGSTRSPTCSVRSRSPRIPGRRRPSRRSGTPRTNGTPSTPWTSFEAAYRAKFPKAVAKITDDVEVLLAVYDFPAEHWIHLRTTNPIESTFATVRHRTKITRGPSSRTAGLAMAFKLIEAAQDRWRAVNGPHLVALVRAGATFVNGNLVERPDDHHQPEAA